MKRFHWLLIGLIGLIMLSSIIVLLIEHEAWRADYQALRADYQALRADYEALGADYGASRADYMALRAHYEALRAAVETIVHPLKLAADFLPPPLRDAVGLFLGWFRP